MSFETGPVEHLIKEIREGKRRPHELYEIYKTLNMKAREKLLDLIPNSRTIYERDLKHGEFLQDYLQTQAIEDGDHDEWLKSISDEAGAWELIDVGDTDYQQPQTRVQKIRPSAPQYFFGRRKS